MSRRFPAALFLFLVSAAAIADREPVLKQVDLPHNYYWREIYLPQLTTGPSSEAWMPDGATLVYSMEGSLWKQAVDADEAFELTHAKGAYDYQPDVARDGRSVVFTRYDGKALELWRLDLASGGEQQLTHDGAVNVEPRLSPDGKRIAWVSTQGSGHFNLFVATIDAAGLHDAHPLLGETKTATDRYYYSAFDHAINPSWSADGRTLFFVHNHDVTWGTGDLWSVPVDEPGKRRRVLSEETNWNMRPEPAPDGKRVLFTSYHGRQSEQLWLTTVDGAAPLPMTFGDSDRRNARWSPDGRRIAFIDNGCEGGNTSLRVIDAIGGAGRTVHATTLHHRTPHPRLVLDIVDENGQRVPARVSVTGSDGRAYAPREAWMHSDDGFDRALQPMENHWFVCASPCALDVPTGPAKVLVQHGFGYQPLERTQVQRPGAMRVATLRMQLVPQKLPPGFGDWISADLHIHMNYGGRYHNNPGNLWRQARAEDLDLAYDLVVNKEERVPDIAWFRPDPDPTNDDMVRGVDDRTRVLHGQEYHTSYWGHLGLLDLHDHYIAPGFSSYRHSPLASPYPDNGTIADLAHAQGGLVGYVHPFDTLPDPAKDEPLTNELPADVVNGKVDYIEIVAFSDPIATATIWYRLLDLGFHLPAAAGSDTMANDASLRGPVGVNRVFLDTGGKRDPASVYAALKAGHGFASNGPLLGLLIDDAKPGGTVQPGTHRYRVALRSIVGVDHLELVQDGKVIKTFTPGGDRKILDDSGSIALDGSWVLLRAWNDHADPLVQDVYPYATTNPVWIGGNRRAAGAKQDAAFFAAWLTRTLASVEQRDDFNDARERDTTLDYLRKARDRYRAMAAGRFDAPKGSK